MKGTRTGLEVFLDDPPKWIQGQRLGLLCNPASVDRHYRHARHLIHDRFPGQLQCLFSPQHGFFAEKQDNMIESDHMEDPELGLPVFSLYGDTRSPTAQMLDMIDTLMVDLLDVGTRVYTFATTVSLCMEAAARHGKTVLVLDRPNPIDGIHTEGNLLALEYASFVGRFPIPMRHGLTMAELALLFNAMTSDPCHLEVIPMRGWRRSMRYPDTGLPWVPPSPNLPLAESTWVYPGQVILEGTNLSEGRGTTRPFEQFGAPFLDPYQHGNGQTGLADVVTAIPGACYRPCAFEPTSNKWQGQVCQGYHIHVTNPDQYRPFEATLRVLHAIYQLHREDFQWKSPPYEYETDKLPVDIITGGPLVRNWIESQAPVEDFFHNASWIRELTAFTDYRRRFMLYD